MSSSMSCTTPSLRRAEPSSCCARDAQHEDQLRPSARWISAAISKAVAEHAGLLFVHAHPDPGHPVGFSPIDRIAILSIAETIGPILEGPFAAAVVHPEGWAGTVVDEGMLAPIERIVSVGPALPSPSNSSAWGPDR